MSRTLCNLGTLGDLSYFHAEDDDQDEDKLIIMMKTKMMTRSGWQTRVGEAGQEKSEGQLHLQHFNS